MVGDANSIVSDVADKRTNVAKFLILVFLKHCEFVDFLRGSRGTKGDVPAKRETKFLHYLLNCANEVLASDSVRTVRGRLSAKHPCAVGCERIFWAAKRLVATSAFEHVENRPLRS